VINKFYLLCVIFSGSPDLTLKTCLVFRPVCKKQRSSKKYSRRLLSYHTDFQLCCLLLPSLLCYLHMFMF